MGGRLRGLAVRSISSAAVGVTVAVVAYLGAYRNLQNSYGLRLNEFQARSLLNALEQWVDEHRKSVGRLPTTLAEIEQVTEGALRRNVDGGPLDPWGRPFSYQVEGDRFELHSFGRDGRPGGEGCDADVYPSSANRPFPPPLTIRQFYFDLPTEGIRRTCQIAGVIAALACFTAPRRHAADVRVMVAGVVGTSIGAILVAIFLSALHVPNGH